MAKEQPLSILGALQELKADILAMQSSHSDDNPAMFEIEGGELELKLVSAKKAGANGGCGFYIFNSKLHGELSKQSIQTLRIKFKGAVASAQEPQATRPPDTAGGGFTLPASPSDNSGPVVEHKPFKPIEG